jgi:hypothetical protein
MRSVLFSGLSLIVVGIAFVAWAMFTGNVAVSGWLKSNEGTLTAVSTIVIALFTVILAVSTWKLFSSTERLVTGADDTARRQLRAYLGVGAEDLAFDTPGENDPKYVPFDPAKPVIGEIFKDFIAVKVRNFGQTPAHDVVVFSYLYVGPPSSRPDAKVFVQDENKDTISAKDVRPFISRAVLQPQQSEISKSPLNDVGPLKKARDRVESIYVAGRIYYKDIYNRTWRTKFCYAWEPWHPSGARFVPFEVYNGEDDGSFPDEPAAKPARAD